VVKKSFAELTEGVSDKIKSDAIIMRQRGMPTHIAVAKAINDDAQDQRRAASNHGSKARRLR